MATFWGVLAVLTPLGLTMVLGDRLFKDSLNHEGLCPVCNGDGGPCDTCHGLGVIVLNPDQG